MVVEAFTVSGKRIINVLTGKLNMNYYIKKTIVSLLINL